MDEEEELENTLIGQQEEAPAMDTGDALIGKRSFLPYAEDVAPSRVNALSVFTPGGDLKTGIDVNAITTSPTTLPDPSAVNTALNKESFIGNAYEDGRPPQMRDANNPAFEGMSAAEIVSAMEDPNYRTTGSVMPNVAESTKLKSRVGQIFDDYVIPSLAFTGDTSAAAIKNIVTPSLTFGNYLFNPNALSLSESLKQVRDFIPDSPLSRAVRPSINIEEMADRQDQLVKNFLSNQASENATKPPAAITSDIDPFTGQTIENPTPFDFNRPDQKTFMDANQRAVADAMANQNQTISNDQIQGVTQGQETTQGQEATAPSLDQTLSQFMRNEDSPEQRTEQFVDPQGRLRRRLTPEASALQGFAPGVQPLAPEYTDFERDSLARQQRIGGTGSFAGDSAAREARLAERDRLPGETQTERDTRIAQSRTTGGQTEGLSFDEARRRAEGELAERGVRNPSASQVNALARLKQAEEPERLAELETKRAKDAADLKTAQATLDRPEFEGKVYTVNGVTFAQTSRGVAQVIDTGAETAEESTAKMKDFVFILEQIDKAREAYSAGDVDKANDILTAAEIQKNGFDVTANEYFGDFSPQVTPPGSTPQVTGTQFDPSQLTGQDREAYNFAINNPNDERSQRILNKLGAN